MRSKRTVEYFGGKQGSDFNSLNLPVQWQSWMRHTRPIPPSQQEIIDDLERIKQLRIKVDLINKRDEEAKLLESQEKPNP
ncbi:Mimitin, mitochondrial [Smittium culicis]|uniref:Mimitin, mitochondrial n=1 Tax=Smittium culicis TaxID=133412 RepID=A0A1R1YB59_9FUNG|nr:Mimitin, mitochondrial [Smittium culicis]